MTRLSPECELAHQKACDEGRDHYVDPESGRIVFTQYYHLKRGECCRSGCRHCPYDENREKAHVPAALPAEIEMERADLRRKRKRADGYPPFLRKFPRLRLPPLRKLAPAVIVLSIAVYATVLYFTRTHAEKAEPSIPNPDLSSLHADQNRVIGPEKSKSKMYRFTGDSPSP